MKAEDIRKWKASAIAALRPESDRDRRAMLTAVVALWEIAEQLAIQNSTRDRKTK